MISVDRCQSRDGDDSDRYIDNIRHDEIMELIVMVLIPRVVLVKYQINT